MSETIPASAVRLTETPGAQRYKTGNGTIRAIAGSRTVAQEIRKRLEESYDTGRQD